MELLPVLNHTVTLIAVALAILFAVLAMVVFRWDPTGWKYVGGAVLAAIAIFFATRACQIATDHAQDMLPRPTWSVITSVNVEIVLIVIICGSAAFLLTQPRRLPRPRKPAANRSQPS